MTETALITGCSSGMGLHTAVALAAAGIRVIATVRDRSRAEPLQRAAAAAGVDLVVTPLDVTDHAAAEQAVTGLEAEHGPISILINNAGRGSVGTAEQLSIAQVQAQLDVNYLGPVRLTQLVLPSMRAAGRGRILTVSSVGGVVGQPFADAYCGAKFAVEGFMQSLSTVVHPFGIWVSVIEPAAVASGFLKAVEQAVEPGPYRLPMQIYLERSESTFAR